MAEEKIPPGLARLWRLSVGSRLGRPAALDTDRVVTTAVELADRDGLAGATLPKIAEALGVTTMSLYRHVGSKDELFVLMGDLALGPAPEPDAGPGRRQDGLRRWAVAQAAQVRRHPWLATLPVGGPPSGPNEIAWLDTGLRLLRETDLDWAAKVGVLSLISVYARSAVRLEQDLADGRRDTGADQAQVEQDYGRTLARLVSPARFPDAAELFASGLFESGPAAADGESEDSDFLFGLDLILDGAAAAIAAARKA